MTNEVRQVLRGAQVIDGTGSPGFTADVVVDGDHIESILPPGRGDGEVIDLDGLVLAPGFVDCHIHYDAQVLWDRDLTPSSWHGVTTVVMGNCGFGIAPTRPDYQAVIARTLENVEGMSFEALVAGIPWTFESFPEYLDAVERGRLRLNAAIMIGHTPLRLYVLGEAATERPATEAEVDQMRRLVGEALDAGAVGFATSKQEAHVGAWGRPVPSRVADTEEITAIVGVLGEKRRGVFAVNRGNNFQIPEMAEVYRRTGCPITFTSLLAVPKNDGMLEELSRLKAEIGAEIWPQVSVRPTSQSVTLRNPGPLHGPAFNEVLALPSDRRTEPYLDPSWRARAREDIARVWGDVYGKMFVQETLLHTELKEGPSIAEIATARDEDPFDVLCELALAEDLKTRFRMILANDDEERLARLLRDDRILVGLSDAGAHAALICDAVFSTYMLQHWVRETGVLSVERAVYHLTGRPAAVFTLPGRGHIGAGAFADLVAFDPESIRVEEMERVFDQPAGADRLVARSSGIESVWVNGTQILADGKELDGVRPGALIRDGGRS